MNLNGHDMYRKKLTMWCPKILWNYDLCLKESNFSSHGKTMIIFYLSYARNDVPKNLQTHCEINAVFYYEND